VLAATEEEDRQESLVLMAAWAQAQEAMKMRDLLGEGRTDAVADTTSSSLVTSQAARNT
jgi:tRNA pseudouridine-54 N-methylase